LKREFLTARFAVNSDGSIFAYATDKIYVRKITGESIVEVDCPTPPNEYYGTQIRMSPDGSILAVLATGDYPVNLFGRSINLHPS
jgi:hypothetical protein